MTVLLNFLDHATYKARDKSRMAAIDEWRAETGWQSGSDKPSFPPSFARIDPFFPPGTAYECPWYFDPAALADAAHPDHERMKQKLAAGRAQIATGERKQIMSPNYFREWAEIRPPILVICPNGDHWIPDQWSNNGQGWVVTGSAANGTFTASPSIQTGRYHGFLQNGRFTPDCERPHAPNGVYRDGTPA
jgi:hypothetical protein